VLSGQSGQQDSASKLTHQIGWMVDDDYTDKEDFAADEAIEFNNRDDNDGNNDNDDNGGDDDNDHGLYSKVATNKKRKKGTHSKQTTLKKTKSVVATKRNKKGRHINNTTINHDYVISGEGDSVIE
jgi:hypothetical protein